MALGFTFTVWLVGQQNLYSLTWHINSHTNVSNVFCLIIWCYFLSTSAIKILPSLLFFASTMMKKILSMLRNPLPAYET